MRLLVFDFGEFLTNLGFVSFVVVTIVGEFLVELIDPFSLLV